MLRFSTLFSDHAVLQRDLPLPVWGFGAEPGARVRVVVERFEAMTLADEYGCFSVRFAPFPAGGPVTLFAESGDVRIASVDIVFGDVFFAGGQSNMAFSIGALSTEAHRDDLKAEYCDHPETFARVRMITVDRVADPRARREFSGVWQTATADRLPQWSAVAASFGRRIASKTGVVVGIVNDNYGGTPAEAWLSREALSRHPGYARFLDDYERGIGNMEERWLTLEHPVPAPASLEEQMKLQFGAPPFNRAAAENWGAPELSEEGWNECQLPGKWTAMNVNRASVVCFRKTVYIPSEWAGGELVLELGIMEQQDIVYFDGVEVGRTGRDFEYMCFTTPRIYTVPAELVTPGRHVVMIRNYCFIWIGGVNGPASAMRLHPADDGESFVALDGSWKFKVETEEGKVPYGRTISAMGPGNSKSCNILFQSMVNPVIPFAMRGVIWYQGETNSGEPELYARLMKLLIEDWRYRWGQGDFPFIQVLLAGYQEKKDFELNCAWAELREAQIEAARATGNVVVSAVDLGSDQTIHPERKMELGERLALAGLREFFGISAPRSPEFRRMISNGGALRVEFDYAERLRRPEGEIGGFFIADETGEFHPADVRMAARDAVELTSDKVRRPRIVRYAWSSHPDSARLCDEASGLPVLPFRAE